MPPQYARTSALSMLLLRSPWLNSSGEWTNRSRTPMSPQSGLRSQAPIRKT